MNGRNGGYSSSQQGGYSSSMQGNGGYTSSQSVSQPVYTPHNTVTTTVYPAHTPYGFYSNHHTARNYNGGYYSEIDNHAPCCTIL